MSKRTVEKIESWVDRHFIGTATACLFLVFFVLFFFKSIFITIPAGHGGALWLRFFGGTLLNFHYSEGTKAIFPWDLIYVYDLRIQQRTKKYDILTREGLQVTVEGTLMYRIKPEAVGVITKYAGADFADTLVMPSIGGIIRLEAGKYSIEEIYSTRRTEIERGVLHQFNAGLDALIDGISDERPEIIIENFWFSSIDLPKSLQSAIEGKLSQRQLSEQYVYVLQREEQESKRKAIEAQGIRQFQDTISGGISENYLRWKGIDATLKLADSPNAKIVVIGSGKEGLPLILGPWESSPAPGTPPATGDRSGAPTGDATARRPAPSDTLLPPRQALPAEPLELNPGFAVPAMPPVGMAMPK